MLIARQPIFSNNGEVYAYELLYREEGKEDYSCEDDNIATFSVISGQFLSRNGVGELTGGKKAFIHFTESLISQDVATLFPTEYLVIEIKQIHFQENEIIERCKGLKDLGYTLVFGDFIFKLGYEKMIDLADIIKIDFLKATEQQKKIYIEKYKNRKIKFLAERIETKEDYQKAVEWGYTYFQGYFFAKPVILPSNILSPNKLSVLKMMRCINQEKLDFEELTHIIETDVGFSYEILRIANSAFFSRGKKINSVHQALLRLGINEIKKWALLAVVRKNETNFSSNYIELVNFSMIRSKFMELFSKAIGYQKQSSVFMTVGILSMLDIIINIPMETMVEELSLTEEIKDVLLVKDKKSILALSYQLILNCERGNWKEVSQIAQKMKVPLNVVADIHNEAIKWTVNFYKETDKTALSS